MDDVTEVTGGSEATPKDSDKMEADEEAEEEEEVLRLLADQRSDTVKQLGEAMDQRASPAGDENQGKTRARLRSPVPEPLDEAVPVTTTATDTDPTSAETAATTTTTAAAIKTTTTTMAPATDTTAAATTTTTIPPTTIPETETTAAAASFTTTQYSPPRFDTVPSLVYEEKFATFTKGVKFARDGQLFAVCTDDNRLHIRRTADLLAVNDGGVPDQVSVSPVATIREAQPIHDFAWHPSHELCAFVTTCNTQPLHLYCGQTGKFLCSYVARNHLDEHVSAYAVQFTRSGDRLLAGYRKFVRSFDVECPGLWSEIGTWKQYQAGIVSALDATGDDHHLLAVGTYCNTVALYDLRDTKAVCHEPVGGHRGGVTQVRFSYDGRQLYSGARKDNAILCRDVRNFGKILGEFPRLCATNQRVQFDLPYEENYLCTGNTDGTAFVWNLRELQPIDDSATAAAAADGNSAFQDDGEDDDDGGGRGIKYRPNVVFMPHSNVRLTRSSATNGVSFHPWAGVIATSSGGRTATVWDDENERVVWESAYENRVKLWKFTQ